MMNEHEETQTRARTHAQQMIKHQAGDHPVNIETETIKFIGSKNLDVYTL